MAPVSYTYEYKSSEKTTTSEGTNSRSVHTTPSGTTVTEASQPAGQQSTSSSTYYPADGNTQSGNTLTQEEADRRYLEAMEDEYAKREEWQQPTEGKKRVPYYGYDWLWRFEE
ncbi:hypothetical protein H072_3113 [Dactylellina haptotyla CBS 200.50]|uniref:Uncharacterized protein n=1 Tax=Dactylellina haptotyla (strain CBS 200.50) TaxID=1284197 RepID=S8BTH2_DACHA|nr:hypothetical protein H072_3113 [Dactylellina haptotyla CBS 200.50]